MLEVEKATEESEDIKKLIIEKERNVKECPAISIGDESVNKASLTLVCEGLFQPLLICCYLFFFLSANFSFICYAGAAF